jgi:hypothetical protein
MVVIYSMRRLMAEHLTMSVQVRVRGLWLARVRLRCAIPLVWLAAKVAGTGFTVDVEGRA